MARAGEMTRSTLTRAETPASAETLPGDVAKAVRLMRRALSQPLSVRELARHCGVPARTLNEHFRRFVGESPMRHLRRLRLAAARHALLSGQPSLSVTEAAQRFVFTHPGRFAEQYCGAFGEMPSETLHRARAAARNAPAARPDENLPAPHILTRETPSVAILVDGAAVGTLTRALSGLTSVVATELSPLAWLSVALPPTAATGRTGARYLLRLWHAEHRERLRLCFELSEAVTGTVAWSGHVEGDADAPFALQDRLARLIGEGIGPALQRAEIGRAGRAAPRDLDAWGLAMRAMPLLFTATPEGASRALELLDRAIDADPSYALPMALTAWAHGQRIMYNSSDDPAEERERSLQLARRAALFGADDPLELTARCAVHMMLGEFEIAEGLVGRALVQDPSNGWAWARSGWLQTYRGNPGTALRHFRRALRFEMRGSRANTLLGIGCAHFDAGRYAAAARSIECALREQPTMAYCNRSLSVSYARLGEHGKARRSAEALRRYHPGLAISDIVAAVPFQPGFIERLANGLEDLGLPP